MARPVQVRVNYMRDIERLGRLRTAILIDRRLSPEQSSEATAAIDALQRILGPFRDLDNAAE
jgi:hypothetical protein